MHGYSAPSERLEKARAMREGGASWGRIVAATGISMFVLKCELKPGYREQERQKTIDRRTGMRMGMPRRQRHLVPAYEPIGSVGHRTEANVIPFEVLAERDKAMKANLTFGQIYLGDPLPGRSALDRRPHE